MTNFAPILLLSALPCLVHGQGSDRPAPWNTGTADSRPLPQNGSIVLAPPDIPDDRSARQDQGNLFRYGIPRPIDINFMMAADWTGSTPESFTGRLTVKSPGATTLNVFFSTFRLAGNARLVVRDAAGLNIENLYSAISIPSTQDKLQTALVPGDEVVIEFQGTMEEMEASALQIQNIVHGTVDFFGTGDDRESYDCLIDVACELGDGWQDEARSVIMFTREDGQGCSGVLLNNTSGDLTPLIYTAHHCRGSFNPNNWVFYFNFQRPSCGSGTAPLSQALYGGEVVAATYGGDFDLIRLYETPPASFQPRYAGWDRNEDEQVGGAFIGHPLSGPKKIGSWTTASTGYYPGFSEPMWMADIDEGGIAGGNSGSPLFNADKRVTGVAFYGNVGCGMEPRQVYAPKLSANWNGPQPSARLKDWLDPLGTDAMAIDGIDPATEGTTSIRVRAKMVLQGAFEPANGLMRAQLAVPTKEPYSAMGYGHVHPGGGELTTTSVLQATGSARIVDWVVIELRQAAFPYNVVATRSALLRRDGLIADLDGSLTGVLFTGLNTTTYTVAVRHRNHLGAMTAEPITFLEGSAQNPVIDFSDPDGPGLYGTEATVPVNGVRCLWMGDAAADGMVKYTGSGNDRDLILGLLGGSVNADLPIYHTGDINLDGHVKYTGAGNDRDPLWTVLDGNAITTRTAQLP